MKLTILIGPSTLGDQRALVEALGDLTRVECVNERDVFRKSVARSRHDAVVLYQADRDGIPNEPLLRYCLDQGDGRPVINVLTGNLSRTASLGNAGSTLSYFPLRAQASPDDIAQLAEYVKEVASRFAWARHADTRRAAER